MSREHISLQEWKSLMKKKVSQKRIAPSHDSPTNNMEDHPQDVNQTDEDPPEIISLREEYYSGKYSGRNISLRQA